MISSFFMGMIRLSFSSEKLVKTAGYYWNIDYSKLTIFIMEMEKMICIYGNNKDNSRRYLIGTVREKPLICIGVNPSTAEPGLLDNALKSAVRVSEANGFDSWIMINIYPQRATIMREEHFSNRAIMKRIENKNLLAILKNFKSYTKNLAGGLSDGSYL